MIATAFTVQGRVIHALILRELKTRFGQMKLGYLWALLEPLLFVGVFAIIYTVAGREPAGMPLFLFLVTGFGSFMFFQNILIFTMHGVRINKTLLTFPQVTPFNIIVARALLEFATLNVVFLLLLAIAYVMGIEVKIENPLGVIGVQILLALLGLGMGLIASTLAVIFPSTPQIIASFVLRPAFLLSGLFFTADSLPDSARDWLLLNPILGGIEYLRSAFFFGFESDFGDPGYLAWWVLAVLCLGLLTQRGLRHKLYRT